MRSAAVLTGLALGVLLGASFRGGRPVQAPPAPPPPLDEAFVLLCLEDRRHEELLRAILREGAPYRDVVASGTRDYLYWDRAFQIHDVGPMLIVSRLRGLDTTAFDEHWNRRALEDRSVARRTGRILFELNEGSGVPRQRLAWNLVDGPEQGIRRACFEHLSAEAGEGSLGYDWRVHVPVRPRRQHDVPCCGGANLVPAERWMEWARRRDPVAGWIP